MKKYVVSALLLSSTVLASEGYAKNAFHGWNIGVGAGYQRLSSSGNGTETSGAASGTAKFQPTANGVVGEIQGGLSRESGKLYYAGKLFLNTSSSQGSTTKDLAVGANDTSNQVKLSQKYGFGVVGHLGGKVSQNTALYGILGVSYTKFRVKYNEPETDGQGSQTKGLVGFPIGAGISRSVSESFRVFGEGTYTFHQSFTTKDIHDEDSDEFKVKIAPGSFNLLFGVTYTF
ncbi:MAG: outer membrane beta-barrel protein [Alphaproteobacteria bacterium]|jgi:hypothetical protein|nr:outer membrane beta-barrel protein [Alphaproteobacteria bacterium]MBT5390272.1 outer membrane beta-barrel protein [Alphaproteobacteria bacterium]